MSKSVDIIPAVTMAIGNHQAPVSTRFAQFIFTKCFFLSLKDENDIPIGYFTFPNNTAVGACETVYGDQVWNIQITTFTHFHHA